MAGKINACVSCSERRITFETICPCMPLCATCIEKYIRDTTFVVLDCPDCEKEMDHEEFVKSVIVIEAEVEKELGRPLGLRDENRCPKCKGALRTTDRVTLPCNTHFTCLSCYSSLVDEAIRSQRLLRCKEQQCRQDPCYSLESLEGRLKLQQITGYSQLVMKKSEIQKNGKTLETLGERFTKYVYGAGNLTGEDEAQLSIMLENIANYATAYEFSVSYSFSDVGECALEGCGNKVYKCQRVSLPGGAFFACTLRCLQIHFLQSNRLEVTTKSRVSIPAPALAPILCLPSADTVAATCELCYGDFLSTELGQLDCKHPICCSCLAEHMSVLIGQGKVNEGQFTCPRHLCTCPIQPQEVQRLFPRGKMFDHFARLRFEDLKELGDSEVVLMCAQPHCQHVFVAEKPSPASKDLSVTCPACGSRLCGLCRSNFHPKYTCEEYKTIQSNRVE